MPVCSVLYCRAKQQNNQPFVTFHRLPRDKLRQEKWLDIIGKDNINPLHKQIFVCSLHFSDSSFNRTLDVMRLKDDTIPLATYNMCCRICLSTDYKLLSLESYGLSGAYEQLTGVTLEHDDGLPRELCVECATLLDKYHKFRDRSIRGNTLLREIYDRHGHISNQLIESNVVSKSFSRLSLHNCCLINIQSEFHLENIKSNVYDNKDIKVEKNYEFEYTVNNVNFHDGEQMIVIDNNSSCKDIDTKLGKDTLAIAEVESDSFDDQNNDDFSYTEQIVVIDDHLINKDVDTNEDVDIKKLENADYTQVNFKLVSNKKTKSKTRLKDKNKTNKHVKNKRLRTEAKVTNIKKIRKHDNDLVLNEYFNLTELSFEEQVKSHEQRKCSDNYLKNKYKCEECYRGFQHEASYNTHMQKHSQERGEFSCKICKATFSKMEFVTKHHRQTHLYRYDCVRCHMSIANRTSAILHATWHEGRTYKCEQCDAVFDKNTTYLGHMRIKHPSDHVCKYCGYSFLGEKGVDSHVTKKHFNETQVPISGPWCSPCNIQFLNDDALQVHNAIKHTQNDRLPRNEMTSSGGGVKSKERTSRTYKRRKPTREQKEKKIQYPVPCEACGLELLSGTEYRFHFMREHPNMTRTFYPYPGTKSICDKCGKVFACKSFLSTHLLSHEESWPYSCETCHKRFKTPLQLSTHRKIHAPPAHACPLCGLRYNQKGNRDRHVKQVHSDEKNFKCDYCEKRFKSSSDKKLHTRHIHWKEPWPKRTRKADKKPICQEDTS